MQIIISTKKLSNFFGITPQAIALWHRRGCPKISHGKWDLKAVFDWYLENVLDVYGTESGNLADVKLVYWQAKAEREHFELEIKRGKFISQKEIEAAWAARVDVVTSGLEAFKNRLSPLLAGKSRQEIANILSEEVYRLRTAYATEERYCPTKK